MNFSRIIRLIFSMLFGTLLVFGLVLILQGKPQAAYASPTDLFASPSGIGSCSQASPCTIQNAVKLAYDGDTIYLSGGTFTGSDDAVITITKSITLYGGWDGAASGPIQRDPTTHVSTIDAQYWRRGIYIEGITSPITVTIDGLTVINGFADAVTVDKGNGGGIYGKNVAITLSNNNIMYNYAGPTAGITAGRGGGIYIRNISTKVVITANLVYSNVANFNGPGDGGGIYLQGGSGNEIINNSILTNTGSITDGLSDGGGILLIGTDNSTILGNTIAGNVAQAGTASAYGSHGGGIHCHGTDNAIIANNLLQNNTASLLANGSGGAIHITSSDDVLIDENYIQENFGSTSTTGGSGRGGAINAYFSKRLMINANQILSNTAGPSYGLGGGVYLSRDTTFNIANNIFADNSAINAGGGVAFETDISEPVTGTLANNTFVRNNFGGGSGATAIDINDSNVLVTITNNIIYSHIYGIYVNTGSTATLSNNLYYQNTTNLSGGGSYIETNPITGQDPLLNNTYHLLFGSPAIDAGTPVYWVSHDIDGDPRPQGAAYDIGADEFLYQNVFLPFVVKSSP